MIETVAPIPDHEILFHFFGHPDDYAVDAQGKMRLRSHKFRTSHELSFNRASIWPLAEMLRLTPRQFGICSLTAAQLRGAYDPAATPKKQPLDVVPAPLDYDPLLRIPNPSHANVNRPLTKAEAGRVADATSQNIHRTPALITAG